MNPRIVIALALVGALAFAQQLTITSPQPVAPGAAYQAVLVNNTAGQLCWSTNHPSFALLQPSGGLVEPLQPGCSDVINLACLAPNQSMPLMLTAPASGPGSQGSHVLLFHTRFGPPVRAVARLHVGVASPGFPAIHSYPDGMPHPRLSHKIAFPPNQVPDWALANTGPAPHVFGAGDRIDLFAPGSAPPVATLPLQGISVPAGGVTVVSLPIAGLAPGPYTVETRWLDPGTTTAMVVRHGIREAFDLELHLPGGRTIAPGATIPAELGTWDGVPVAYALVLGLAPGALVLPNGAVAPIVLDPLVVRSLADGLGGLLTANRGAMIPERCGLAPGPVGATATGLGLTHPGSPALAGVVLRVAAVAWTANLGLFVASQPEEIALR